MTTGTVHRNRPRSDRFRQLLQLAVLALIVKEGAVGKVDAKAWDGCFLKALPKSPPGCIRLQRTIIIAIAGTEIVKQRPAERFQQAGFGKTLQHPEVFERLRNRKLYLLTQREPPLITPTEEADILSRDAAHLDPELRKQDDFTRSYPQTVPMINERFGPFSGRADI